MTALEQALMQELEQEKALSTELISKLEEQESSFLRQLQQMQTAYEKSLSQVVENYQNNMEAIHKEYKSYLMQSNKEQEQIGQELSRLSKSNSQMQEALEGLPNYENLVEELKTLLNLRER